MTAAGLIDALDMPASSRVDRRVPKTLLLENSAPTAGDKRQINEGIEELQWVAALKIYQSEDGRTKLDVRLEDQTAWLNQKLLTELFGKTEGTISGTSSTSLKTKSWPMRQPFGYSEQFERNSPRLATPLSSSATAPSPMTWPGPTSL